MMMFRSWVAFRSQVDFARVVVGYETGLGQAFNVESGQTADTIMIMTHK